jgi:putative ABC transport system permease protein
MRSWHQLTFRTWRQRPGRTAGAVLAIALGVAVVVWIASCYESARQWVTDLVYGWVGKSQIYVRSPLGKWGWIPIECVEKIRALNEVAEVTATLRQPTMKAVKQYRDPNAAGGKQAEPTRVEVFGIDPANELKFRSPRVTEGRYLRPGDALRAVLESGLAEIMDVHVGDHVLIFPQTSAPPWSFEVVGIIHKRRIGKFQYGAIHVPIDQLAALTNSAYKATNIDVILKDGSLPAIHRAQWDIQRVVRPLMPGIEVASAEARLKQMQAAQEHFQQILLRISGCALLTSFFVILTTLTVGVMERIAQIGLMRCVGLTRLQLVWLILMEVLPMGLIGIALGIPIGMGLTVLTVKWLPEYFSIESLAISRPGIVMGIIAGSVSTLMGALVWPAPKALLVSPIEASRPRARRHGRWVEVASAAVGLVFVLQQFWFIHRLPLDYRYFLLANSASTFLAFIGYALMTPAVVIWVGQWMLAGMAMLLGIHPRLMRDQVGQVPWRSTGICCGLMVGLALIVALLVHAESVIYGWRFPQEFPEAYVWSWDSLPPKTVDAARKVPGVKQISAFGEFRCLIGEPHDDWRKYFTTLTRFITADPNSWPDVVKLQFVEGDTEDALAKMRRGGYILVAQDFANAHNKHLDDRVLVRMEGMSRHFIVAGVVTSTAIEIAASFFEADAELQVACVGSVVGTIEDARRYFGSQFGGVKMFLLNFDLPPQPVPPHFPENYKMPQASEGELEFGLPIGKLGREDQWQRYREMTVLTEVKKVIGNTFAWSGSVRELKKRIDAEIRTMVHILTLIPAFFLVIAGIGVLNLMMSNIASRTREIALLRAVGTTETQVQRMVIGEAMVLGLLSGVIGLPLGIQLAHASNVFTGRMWGFWPELALPWDWIVGTVALTMGVCLIAGLWPAHRASRSNVIDALAAQ